MKNSQNPVIVWLFAGAILVASMVVIGGITRLTQSGLSMVEWNLIMGSVPPLNEADWQISFDKYKSSPEYKIVNKHFTLQEFKSIFWWEYIHRMLGRLIGIIFIIPFVIFLIQKRIDKPLLWKLVMIFILGGFQGFLGWFMVKSGLVNDPHVSHYRLAAHLVAALTLFSLIFWITLDLIYKEKDENQRQHDFGKIRKLGIFGLTLLGLQIVYGAFVAGLKAGLYYNTWPKMGTGWMPSEVFESVSRAGLISFLDNITLVQFIHRWLGWAVFGIVIWIFIEVRKGVLNIQIAKGVYFIFAAVLLQITLGVLTLIYQVPVALGVIHQFGALLLLAGFIFLINRSNVAFQ